MGNPYFGHGGLGLTNEYNLYNSATDEIVEMFGIDFTYLPRILQKPDWVFGEDVLSSFEETFGVTLYVENDEMFGGNSDLFNKFGFSIAQDMTLSVQQERLDNILGRAPLESDLLYHLPSKKLFEIKNLEHENDFFQMGGGGLSDSGKMKYIFTVKLFQQSFETFDTDNTTINSLGIKTDINKTDEKEEFNNEQASILNFSASDIFGNI